jgi:hypothetical protein
LDAKDRGAKGKTNIEAEIFKKASGRHCMLICPPDAGNGSGVMFFINSIFKFFNRAVVVVVHIEGNHEYNKIHQEEGRPHQPPYPVHSEVVFMPHIKEFML